MANHSRPIWLEANYVPVQEAGGVMAEIRGSSSKVVRAISHVTEMLKKD